MKLKVNISDLVKKLMGIEIVNHIRNRTQDGKDKDGKAFKPYSTKPFAMPSGATTQLALKTLDNSDGLIWFTAKSGNKWIVVKDGYKALKQARRPQDGGTVNLTNDGQMMNDLAVIAIPRDGIDIGFNRAENAEKALWNIEAGRDFLGIEDSELEKIAEKYLDSGVTVEVI